MIQGIVNSRSQAMVTLLLLGTGLLGLVGFTLKKAIA